LNKILGSIFLQDSKGFGQL